MSERGRVSTSNFIRSSESGKGSDKPPIATMSDGRTHDCKRRIPARDNLKLMTRSPLTPLMVQRCHLTPLCNDPTTRHALDSMCLSLEALFLFCGNKFLHSFTAVDYQNTPVAVCFCSDKLHSVGGTLIVLLCSDYPSFMLACFVGAHFPEERITAHYDFLTS